MDIETHGVNVFTILEDTMKSLLKNLLCCFMLLILVAACENKKEAAGEVRRNVGSPILNPNLDQSGQDAFQALKQWYESTNEVATIGSHGNFLKKTQSASSGFQFNFSLCISGIIQSGCTQPSGCYIQNNGLKLGLPIITDNKYMGCNVTGAAVYSKANNQELKNALTGKGLKLMKALRSGNIFTLYYGPEGHLQPTLVYVVNTSLHSLLNPVVIMEAGQETRLIDFKILAH
jgi:hypothetical protein